MDQFDSFGGFSPRLSIGERANIGFLISLVRAPYFLSRMFVWYGGCVYSKIIHPMFWAFHVLSHEGLFFAKINRENGMNIYSRSSDFGSHQWNEYPMYLYLCIYVSMYLYKTWNMTWTPWWYFWVHVVRGGKHFVIAYSFLHAYLFPEIVWQD